MSGDALVFTSASDRADAGAFLARAARLDPAALVRIRCDAGRIALWTWLPLEVLATRVIRGEGPPDVTVSAAAVLAAVTEPAVALTGPSALVVPSVVALPHRRDADWRGALPPESPADELDAIPADVIQQLLAAGERTFREASAGADPRAVGDVLLDHEVLTVSAGDQTATVPLRVLLALARMGFLGDDPLRVGLSGGWVRAAASYGAVYRRRSKLTLLSPGAPSL